MRKINLLNKILFNQVFYLKAAQNECLKITLVFATRCVLTKEVLLYLDYVFSFIAKNKLSRYNIWLICRKVILFLFYLYSFVIHHPNPRRGSYEKRVYLKFILILNEDNYTRYRLEIINSRVVSGEPVSVKRPSWGYEGSYEPKMPHHQDTIRLFTHAKGINRQPPHSHYLRADI